MDPTGTIPAATATNITGNFPVAGYLDELLVTGNIPVTTPGDSSEEEYFSCDELDLEGTTSQYSAAEKYCSKGETDLEVILLRRVSGKTLTVNLFVNGTTASAVLDTGAHVTIVSENLVSHLDICPITHSFVRLKGATPGMTFQGTRASLVFEIGKHEYPWEVIIAPISDDVLLGSDFITHHGGMIDTVHKILILKD